MPTAPTYPNTNHDHRPCRRYAQPPPLGPLTKRAYTTTADAVMHTPKAPSDEGAGFLQSKSFLELPAHHRRWFSLYNKKAPKPAETNFRFWDFDIWEIITLDSACLRWSGKYRWGTDRIGCGVIPQSQEWQRNRQNIAPTS